MELLTQLEEYLRYMNQMGFSGLALEKSPFLLPPAGPVARPLPPPRPIAGVPQGAPPPAQRPHSAAPLEAARPKLETPNLSSIMATVDLLTHTVDTHKQAQAVTGANSMEVLKNLYLSFQRCQACALGTTRNRFVFGEGPPDAKVVFVGEFPSRVDDGTGRPFMDEAGQLLTKIISAMGLNRADVFITNVVKCAPPERMPLPDELDACAPVLERQIQAVNPKVIVALGPCALRFFRGEGASLVRVHGQLFDWKGFRVVATYHPSYILRNPRAKRDVWEDLKQVLPLIQG